MALGRPASSGPTGPAATLSGRIVWQYGTTDRPGLGPGSLNVPDGIDVVPPDMLGAFALPGG
jgi:hypothetical protein